MEIDDIEYDFQKDDEPEIKIQKKIKKYFNNQGKLIKKEISKPCTHILPDHHCRNYEEENCGSSKFSKKHVNK